MTLWLFVVLFFVSCQFCWVGDMVEGYVVFFGWPLLLLLLCVIVIFSLNGQVCDVP